MLNFKEVSYANLIPGKYLIVPKGRYDKKFSCIAVFAFISHNGYAYFRTVEYIILQSIATDNEIVKNNITKDYMLTYDDTMCSYFSIISKIELIQNNMEMRAINKLLQRITGDDTFKY